MSVELVTVATFPTAPQAELARGYLQAQGIAAVLDGAQLATIYGARDVKWFGVRVQVCREDAPAADRALAQAQKDWDDAGPDAARIDRCLACGAALAASATRCAACGWTWQSDRPAT